uniref:Reverse transcriptase/retrotransposon-derived protein RNase H-like domain-containing protein n=1 Tax=Gossypium raimondii TaxID=29730 RepID=A0A0D2TK42_GOSRA|nr:hypothetical protein B456_007G235600 [Gossypium raimondii]
MEFLQTDASDKYWGAILFEEENGKRRLYGYKSGRFTDAEIHYHSTFKEILAVKKDAEIQTKEVPHSQLLRWAEWFSKFSFNVVHIKGKTNVLTDILTRPLENFPENLMIQPSSSSKGKEVLSLILEKKFHREAMNMMLSYQLDIFRDFCGLFLKPLGLYSDYPFIHPIKFQFIEFLDELKWMLWYLTHLFHIGIEFFIEDP